MAKDNPTKEMDLMKKRLKTTNLPMVTALLMVLTMKTTLLMMQLILITKAIKSAIRMTTHSLISLTMTMILWLKSQILKKTTSLALETMKKDANPSILIQALCSCSTRQKKSWQVDSNSSNLTSLPRLKPRHQFL